jgi:hypothetical protein
MIRWTYEEEEEEQVTDQERRLQELIDDDPYREVPIARPTQLRGGSRVITIKFEDGIYVVREGIAGRPVGIVTPRGRGGYSSMDLRTGFTEMRDHPTLDAVREHFDVTHTIEEDRGQYRDTF